MIVGNIEPTIEHAPFSPRLLQCDLYLGDERESVVKGAVKGGSWFIQRSHKMVLFTNLGYKRLLIAIR